MGKPSILVTIPEGAIRHDFFPVDIVSRLDSVGSVTWNESGKELDSDDLASLLQAKSVCITGWGAKLIGESVLSRNEELKLIAHVGGTVADIVDSYAFRKGIKVVSANSVMAESVAECVVCYALCGLREVVFYANELQRGVWWQDCTYHYEGLLDRTIGLVGFGMVARFLVDMLQPFRVCMKVYDPHASPDVFREYSAKRVVSATLEEALACRVVSLHASLTGETVHMIDKRLLSLIPDGALLINTARGKLIDETALEDELARGRISAVLDVYEQEPLPGTSRLRGLRNAVLLPHMAGPTSDRRRCMTLSIIEDIERFIRKEPLRHEIAGEYASRMTRKI